MRVIQRLSGRAAMRVALLGLCTGLVGVIPMVAQDTSTPPPPPAQDGSAPPQMGNGGRGRGGPGRMQERQLEMMTKELNLTPDQVTQIKAIYADTEKQMLALRDDTSTAPADKREKMTTIRRDSMTRVQALLTDDQKKKLAAMMEKRREQREERPASQPN